MTLKRLLMPVLVTGIILTMGSMVFGQGNTVTCGIGEAGADATVGPNAFLNPAAGLATVAGVPTATANATSTGLTEPLGAGATGVPAVAGGGLVRVACTPSAGFNPGPLILTISFGLPITNSSSYPTTAAGIRIVNGSGDFVTSGAVTPNVGISSTSISTGTLTIGLGTPTTGASTFTTGITFTAGKTSTFDIAGVLLSVCGLTGAASTSPCPSTPTNVTATITSVAPAGVVTAGTPTNPNANTMAAPIASFGTSATVITAVTAGLSNPGVAAAGALPAAVLTALSTAGVCANTSNAANSCAGGPAALTTTGTATHTHVVMKVTEGFAGEFKSATQFNGGAVIPTGAQGVEVWIKLTGQGSLSIASCSGVVTQDATGATVDSTLTTNITQLNSGGQIKVGFAGTRDAASLGRQETLWVGCIVSLGSAVPPLTGTVTAQMEVGPIAGGALTATVAGATVTAFGSGNIPRYEDILVPATGFTIIQFPPVQSTLLLPFAFVGTGINTGISIANTTTDIFGTSAGGAAPNGGTITFTLYPSATDSSGNETGGTAVTFTTKNIGTGGSWTHNVSEILPSGTTTFRGYIFAAVNFSQAHGSATIYDTTTGHAMLSAPVLVVASGTSAVSAVAPRTNPEGLSQ